MIISWISKKGDREVNEDAIRKKRCRGITCVAVADGLGGYADGRLAAEIAVEAVMEAFANDAGFSREHLRRYIMYANEKVTETAKSDPNRLHMSSTVAVLLLRGRCAIWANVGDSRVYRLCDGVIAEVSEDHSLAFLDFVNGDIEYDDIRTSPNQSKLTSALGVAMDGINISEKTHMDASTSFVLCTDGWWEYVKDSEMEEEFRVSSSSREWLGKMTKIRERTAPSGNDNFTCAIVMI